MRNLRKIVCEIFFFFAFSLCQTRAFVYGMGQTSKEKKSDGLK